MTDALYPPSPALADTTFLEPSAEFKGKTYRMIFGIVLFIVLYLALIAFSALLLMVCSVGAFFIVALRVSWITIVIGLGLVALGVMFFIFTIKFIFATTNEYEPLEIQIYEKDQPMLFDFIRKLSKEVGTDFPRKIFLVPEVNASVSYNSSFWSMFLPVRKNLRIGLGLVNTLNLGEFKATIAHEFGHFSQRSMKTGSYVYTMNKIIYNLVYQRDKFDSTLDEWAATGGWFGIFASITGVCVNGVRSILHTSYNKLNVTYRALSREMEYHADLVACSVAGNDAIVNTLRKLDFGDSSYQAAIGGLNNMARKKKQKVSDIYKFHAKTMTRLASANKLSMKNGLPVITLEDLDKNVNKSRIVMKDQWASHPSREEREKSINRVSIQSPVSEDSAWAIFTNPEATREAMTKQLYMDNEKVKDLTVMTDAEMDDFVREEGERDTISPTFLGIYDNRMLSKFDPDKAYSRTSLTFDQLINTEASKMIQGYHRDGTDFETLQAISRKLIRIDYFEYDNIRYKWTDAKELADKLEVDVKKAEKDIQLLDENIFTYYRQRASESGREEEFLDLYRKLSTKRTDHEAVLDFAGRLHTMKQEMASRTEWREDQVTNLCFRIQEIEKQVKRFMQELPEDLIKNHFAEPKKVFQYLKTQRLWNESDRTFNQEGFAQLQEYIVSSMSVASDVIWSITKEIYNKQVELTPQEFIKTE
jgi:Zn-dependent protease with chaperone function